MAMPWIVSAQCELSLASGVYTTLWNVTPVLESLCLSFGQETRRCYLTKCAVTA
jgi:hypothetical protein